MNNVNENVRRIYNLNRGSINQSVEKKTFISSNNFKTTVIDINQKKIRSNSLVERKSPKRESKLTS